MRKSALWFEFDGRSSMPFEVYQVNFENGLMQSETIIPSRSINKVQRQNSSVVDFYSISNSPLAFDVNCYCSEELTEDRKVEIMRWLKKDVYKLLRFETMPENYYYAIATEIDLTHDTMRKGYFTVKFECNAPYAYTKVLMSDLLSIEEEVAIDIESNSVYETQIIRILCTINEDSDMKIYNQSNGTEIYFKELEKGTKISIDCLNHNIYAEDIDGKDILIQDKKQNHSWLEFVAGNNHLILDGKCDIQIFWQGNRI